MAKPSVLVLYNQPLLPNDHPDAESEHSVVEIAKFMATTLNGAGLRTSMLGLGPDPGSLWRAMKRRPAGRVVNLLSGSLDNTPTESYSAGVLELGGVTSNRRAL